MVTRGYRCRIDVTCQEESCCVISTNRSCTKVLERNTASTAHLAALHWNPHPSRSFHVHNLQACYMKLLKGVSSPLRIASQFFDLGLVVFLLSSSQTKKKSRQRGSFVGKELIRGSVLRATGDIFGGSRCLFFPLMLLPFIPSLRFYYFFSQEGARCEMERAPWEILKGCSMPGVMCIWGRK